MAARYLHHPQSVWLRRALFQLHLWVGLTLGLYIIAMCVSGSALVVRHEIDQTLCPRHVTIRAIGPEMSQRQLLSAAREAYPRLRRARIIVHMPPGPDAAARVEYLIGSSRIERLFDPYTGRNLGDTVGCEPPFVTWLASFHDHLLVRGTGDLVNGVGAVLLTLMCLTGAVIWWPGRRRWRHSLTLRLGVHWRRFTWQLHSVLGFWLFLLLLMWALSAVYLTFPDPLSALMQHFLDRGDLPAFRRIYAATRVLANLHFGRAYGTTVQVLWVVLGLTPAALFITGAIMWWNRVVRRAMGRAGQPSAKTAAAQRRRRPAPAEPAEIGPVPDQHASRAGSGASRRAPADPHATV